MLQGASGPGLSKLLTLRRQLGKFSPSQWRRGPISSVHQSNLPRRQDPVRHHPVSNQPCVQPPPSLNAKTKNQFDNLLQAAHAAQASLFAEGTKRNHKSNITQFMFFCIKFEQPVCPTTRDTLMAFARLASLTVSYGTSSPPLNSFIEQTMNLILKMIGS